MLKLQEFLAAMQVATQLFPLITQLVHAGEQVAPNLPGKAKLDSVMATVQTTLTAVAADTQTIATVTNLVPGMVAGAKAAYNSQLAANAQTTTVAAPVTQ